MARAAGKRQSAKAPYHVVIAGLTMVQVQREQYASYISQYLTGGQAKKESVSVG
jgi:hypothetical protein